MNKTMKVLGALLLVFTTTSAMADKEDQEGNFTIISGSMLVSQPGEKKDSTNLSNVPVSILLDSKTGETWVLVAGPTGQWARITFAGKDEKEQYTPH